MPVIKVALIGLVLVLLLTRFLNRPNANLKTVTLNIGSQSFALEKAITTLEHSRGLSGRTSLCPNCGMVFIFNTESIQTFWMKNTLIPLDIIFLNKDGVINTIHSALPQPSVSDLKLKLYSSSAPSLYVIELPAGTTQKLGLTVGFQINLAPLK
ncbi:MAG: DUF192 domain-containing protein [Candidatus Shapirobacteria bacterium]